MRPPFENETPPRRQAGFWRAVLSLGVRILARMSTKTLHQASQGSFQE
ncbi:hypothetical protein [Devosia sp. DBB001]|nr:hypothetical protein [Devosia sp. DBB001]